MATDGSKHLRAGRDRYDALIIGSGPNGLSAGITIARAGGSVLVVEAKETVGGGTRSAELTLPGFVHDICSAIHPTAVASPFFQDLPLSEFGLEWIYPPAAVAHPLPNGQAALLSRSVDETARSLGEDERSYRRLFAPLVKNSRNLLSDLLRPLGIPNHPFTLTRFGLHAWKGAYGFSRSRFRTDKARALFAGNAGHSLLPLETLFSASFGLVLMVTGHAVGWPLAKGGSQRVADSMTQYLRSLGGEVATGFKVSSLRELPLAKAYLFDTAPRLMAEIAGQDLPQSYRDKVTAYRHGPGVFKVDWALDGEVPWLAPECRQAATVHVGGTLDEVALAERSVWAGEHPEKPFVLFAQQSLFDGTRAPAGKATGWGYCHVPSGSTVDMTDRIEAQIERFAPGFKERILKRSTMNTADFQHHNANYIGGDIAGGSNRLPQLFFRPVIRLSPYTTPNPKIYLCSSSTPPGGGVHGLCGYFAAKEALKAALK